MRNGLKRAWQDTAVRQGTLVFMAARLFFTLWAALMAVLLPPPVDVDEGVRPYLDEPQLNEGTAGLLLGPWQRFDTQHYMRIARDGYAHEEDSVFPPLYPWLVRGAAALFGGGAAARLTAALLISNLATWALLILLHKVAASELGADAATRTLVYFVLFPTGFFLFAAYTESLFILLALGSFWAGRNGRYPLAGILGFLAAATRLTGWVLVIPLAYFVMRNESRFTFHVSRQTIYRLLFTALPPLALVLFMIYRWQLGLPPLTEMYGRYWHQSTGFPGRDVGTAVQTLFFSGDVRRSEIIALALDFASTLLLAVTTMLAFRRLGVGYGLYAAMLLLFMLLPTSPVKPLYSFSRYTLAFFPTFLLMAQWGRQSWAHRLILYPSFTLALFYSGQFFIWGW
ncbi:MAG: hypothetical protein KC415_09015, partial [Anaerolineales bacterium]|nr:hypothetical protein [Anaerolineales bacterium]